MANAWRSFQGGAWEREINVRDFIQKNYGIRLGGKKDGNFSNRWSRLYR